MSSLRRKLSAQANGRQSHGPTTPEGKHRSSQNAVSHGLLSNCVVLHGESREGFDTLVNQYLERFGPVDCVEQAMIEEMVSSYWRMRRAWAMETELMTAGMASQPGDHDRARMTAAFRQLASSPELPLLHRYETRLHLMYQRALHNILLLRTVGQVTDLPTQQSDSPPTPPPADPASSPNQTSPASQPTDPPPAGPAQWDRPSSSVVCQPFVVCQPSVVC